VERILRLEETSTAGQCASCGAPHSTGAAYCWQCGQPLLREVHTDQIAAPQPTVELPAAQPTSELYRRP
jgi:predicted amidophosphoribosyltransferase